MTDLLQMIEDENIELLEVDMHGRNKGFYIDRTILLDRKMCRIDKRCKLAEELGHHFMTVGDITDQTKVENRKQERIARKWGYDELVPIHRLVEAINYPCQTKTELAEYMDVPEDYLLEALNYYKQKYGQFCYFNDYCIWFEPLRIMKRIE